MKPGIKQGCSYFGYTVEDVTMLFVRFRGPAGVGYTTMAVFQAWLRSRQRGAPAEDGPPVAWMGQRKRHNRGCGNRRIVKADGKVYRRRRGRLVEIPPEWVGRTTHPQTIRKRPSKKRRGRRFRRKVMR